MKFMKNFKVVTKVVVEEERIVDMFLGASEGGSNYWCKNIIPKSRSEFEDYYSAMLNGFSLIDRERGKEGRKFFVSREDIKNAVQLMADKELRHFSDMVNGNDDAITADVFLQLCAFGKVIYG